MRATISFDVDVEQVEGTMGVLVAQEAHSLRAAADILEDYTGPRNNLLEEVTESLRLMEEATAQLRQYKSMIVNFQRARLGTTQPQTAPASQETFEDASTVSSFSDMQTVLDSMEGFDSFLSQLPADQQLDLEVETDEPEEG
ncbi:MAG: hypothetical protein ACYS5F_12840 [Planctomycetota bacterium]|jgi:hypothetical protein